MSVNLKGTIRVIVVSIYASALLMYPLALFFIMPQDNRDKLFKLVSQGSELQVLKEYGSMSCRVICASLVGMIVHICIWCVSFYFSFGFVTVWESQRKTWIICTLIAFLLMHSVCEVLMEMIIAVMYKCRRKATCILHVGHFMNVCRNYRLLWP